MGADTVPKKLGEPLLIGTGSGNKTFDVKSQVPNYNSLNIADFLIDVTSMSLDASSDGLWPNAWSNSASMSKSYNATSGILTINGSLSINSNSSHVWARSNIGYKIYLK